MNFGLYLLDLLYHFSDFGFKLTNSMVEFTPAKLYAGKRSEGSATSRGEVWT